MVIFYLNISYRKKSTLSTPSFLPSPPTPLPYSPNHLYFLLILFYPPLCNNDNDDYDDDIDNNDDVDDDDVDIDVNVLSLLPLFLNKIT